MVVSDLKRLPESQVEHLEQLLASWEAAVAAGGEDERALVADFLVDEGIGVRQGLKRFWDYRWGTALSGAVKDLREEGTALRLLLTRGGDALKAAAAVARTLIDGSGRDVARLAAFEEQARSFPEWAEECLAKWEMLGRPRKPLEHEKIARSRAAFARGECEDPSTLVQRLPKE